MSYKGSAFALLVLGCLPTAASAVSFTPNPVVISGGGLSLTLEAIGSSIDVPPGGVRTDTSGFPAAPAGTPSIGMRATNTGTAAIGFLAFLPVLYADGGWIPGTGEPDARTDVTVDRCGPAVECATFAGGLAPGATSNDFFLFAPFPPSSSFYDGLDVSAVAGTLSAGPVRVTFVPEPGSAVLVVAGLATLAGCRTSQRGSR